MRILVLHAYSAHNAGDGLLVEETIALLREAFSADASISVVALHPETFDTLDATVIDGSVGRRGISRALITTLRRIDEHDLVIGVGGGYLRTGHLGEAFKTLGAHGLQLLAAGSAATPAVYLPQSIGPLRLGTRPLFRRLLARLDMIYVRDDLSQNELDLPNVVRLPDLALMMSDKADRSDDQPDDVPVLTVRAVRGKIGADLFALAERLGTFDGYIQSIGAGNDDRQPMAAMQPRKLLTRQALLGRDGRRRVVVAVRLHAALMALNAGHWVIHLAYERKGFGAFADLGLSDFVFSVNSFAPDRVAGLARDLVHEAHLRRSYNERLRAAAPALSAARALLVADLRRIANEPQRREASRS